MLVTLTIFGFRGFTQKSWMFAQMGVAGFGLGKIAGLRFSKLMGSGHGSGFSLQPNFGRYAFLAVWENAENADNFLQNSAFISKFRRRAFEEWTIRMLPFQSRGSWNGQNPFLPLTTKNSAESPTAVLTRADIRPSKLRRFWSFVPQTSAEISAARGLIASIGIGELPFIKQATFSLWESEAAAAEFAYKSVHHKEVVRLTRAENWYSEDLFARFVPLSAEGVWNGKKVFQ